MARIFKLNVVSFVTTPAAPTVTPTGGAAGSYSYKLVATDSTGATTAASTAGSTAAGPTTLDGTHFNTITWTDPVAAPASVKIYRTAGGATQGLIGTVNAGVQTFTDNGVVADGTVAPTSNSTGVGAYTECASLREKYLQFGGTFVSTNQIQGSIDGTNWVNEGSAVTTSSVVAVNPSYVLIRNSQTGYTSGSVAITLCGHEER